MMSDYCSTRLQMMRETDQDDELLLLHSRLQMMRETNQDDERLLLHSATDDERD
jgi:hypothetical protein